MHWNKTKLTFLIAVFSFFSQTSVAAVGTDLISTSVAVDILGEAGPNTSSPIRNGLTIREAELVFYSPADHLFDGQMSLSAHWHTNQHVIDLHEAFIASSRLIPRSRFRIGQFFLGWGRLNHFHRHDWPFTSAPVIINEIFDNHGVYDSGIEYSWLTPLPFYLDITAGITTGWTFGHEHGGGSRPQIPTHYLRTENFWELSANTGMQTGLNFIRRKDSSGYDRFYFGIDSTTKWRHGKTVELLIQSEVWLRDTEKTGQSSQKEWGFYLYPEYALTETWKLGIRLDYWSELSQTDLTGKSVASYELGIMPTLSYRASEFSLFRFTYNYQPRYFNGQLTSNQQFVQIQTVFLLGAHPAHDF